MMTHLLTCPRPFCGVGVEREPLLIGAHCVKQALECIAGNLLWLVLAVSGHWQWFRRRLLGRALSLRHSSLLAFILQNRAAGKA
jgi:hypothetical protein